MFHRLSTLCFVVAFVFLATTSIQAKNRNPHLQPVGVDSSAVEVKPDAPGTYYLEMDAAVPPDRPEMGVRYSVWVGDREIVEQMGRGKWDVNFIPYFAIDPVGDGKTGRFRYVRPIKVKAGQSVYVTYPSKGGTFFDDKPRPTVSPRWEGRIDNVRLRPAVEGIGASMSTGADHHVFFPSENPTATIRLTGPPGKSVQGQLALQSLHLADSLGGNNWNADTRVSEIQRTRTEPVEVEFDDNGKARLNIKLPNDAYRLLGATLMLEQGKKLWTRYLGSVAIVPERDTTSWHRDGFFLVSPHLDVRKGRPNSRATTFGAGALMEALKKMGLDWIRQPFFWKMWEPEEGKVTWKETDVLMETLRKHRINLMHIVGPVPRWARTPETDEMDKTGYRGGWKVDTTPDPERLDQFSQAHAKFFQRYSDMIRGTNVWNEPWEGFGITGWMSTGEHYREIIRAIRKAADTVDPPLRVIAADSPHNTQWKLFAADMEDAIDAISTHYMDPMAGHAFALANYYGKDVWETETWLAWRGDNNSIRHALGYLALGGDRISLWHPAMLFTNKGYPTTSVVWAAAMRHLLRDTDFSQVLHPERPPFVLLFEGRDTDRHVAVVVTNVASRAKNPREMFRYQFRNDQLQMRLPADQRLEFYDVQANTMQPDRSDDHLNIPVNATPRYVEFRGPVEEFRDLLTGADYQDLTPVEIVVPGDLTTSLSQDPQLAIELRNAYDEPIEGEVVVQADALKLGDSSQQFTLEPVERRTFHFPVTGATTAANRYPIRVRVRTDHGNTEHEETIHQALIVQGSPTIDGNIDEWGQFGAVPVLLSADQAQLGASLTEQAWFPWKDLATDTQEFTAQVAFAADEENLYLMARVRDGSRNQPPSMLTDEQLHEFQEGAEHIYVKAGPIPGASGDMLLWNLGHENQHNPKYEVHPPDHPLHRMGSLLRHQFQYMIYPTGDGEAEIMRVRKPGFYYIHPLPIDYVWLKDNATVEGARVVVNRREAGYTYEVAIPWRELEGVPHAPGDRVRMNFAVQDKGSGNRLTWSAGRGLSTKSKIAFEPTWTSDWTNETWWGFVTPPAK
ncbi:MAG: hypothetical protein ACLFWL_09660 [Candidatus Brocadiia bacterium]